MYIIHRVYLKYHEKLYGGSLKKALDDGGNLKGKREEVLSKQWNNRQHPETENLTVHMGLEKFCVVDG